MGEERDTFCLMDLAPETPFSAAYVSTLNVFEMVGVSEDCQQALGTALKENEMYFIPYQLS